MATVSATGTRYSSPTSWNGRTSTGAPQASDPLAAQASAASRSGAVMTQKPPSCSLVSANGPSVVTTCPFWERTTVAVSGGWRPPAKTQAPADWTSALNASTALNRRWISSSGGTGSPSTVCTASRYCLMAGLPSSAFGWPRAGPLIAVTNGGPPESAPARASVARRTRRRLRAQGPAAPNVTKLTTLRNEAAANPRGERDAEEGQEAGGGHGRQWSMIMTPRRFLPSVRSR